MKQTKQVQLTRERIKMVYKQLEKAVNSGRIWRDYEHGRFDNEQLRFFSQMQLDHIKNFWENLPTDLANHEHYKGMRRDVNYLDLINHWPPETPSWGDGARTRGLICFDQTKGCFDPMFLSTYLGLGLTLDLVEPDRVISLATSAVPLGAYAEFFGFPVSVYDIHSEDRFFDDGREMSPQQITHLRGDLPKEGDSILLVDDICCGEQVIPRAKKYFKERQMDVKVFVNYVHLGDGESARKILKERGDPLERYYTLCPESRSWINPAREGGVGYYSSKLIKELVKRKVDVKVKVASLLKRIGY